MKYQSLIATPIGSMIAQSSDSAILSLDFADKTTVYEISNHPLLVQLQTELTEYFGQKRQIFTLPLAPTGTPFQQQSWKILQTIPYGQTISYAEEAKKFGNPKATRAVANANGKNPIAILIPCHRVIASGGGLGGYSGGLWRKEFLLKLEHAFISSNNR